jgi:hypothetical protein
LKSRCAYEEAVIIATALFDSDDDRLLPCAKKAKKIDRIMAGDEEDGW